MGVTMRHTATSVTIWQEIVPSGPVYGPERDHFVRQARAVLNCHFYDTSRFEQVRASQCEKYPRLRETWSPTMSSISRSSAKSWCE